MFDKTEIQGDYDLLINFDVYQVRNQTAPPDYNKPQLPLALQEQLGLKLEPLKASSARRRALLSCVRKLAPPDRTPANPPHPGF